jgi:SAM-dependent methyltransferase/FKBP-type peptidyl-prolyl cis-trans isomerase 2
MDTAGAFLSPDAGDEKTGRNRCDRTDRRTLADIEFRLSWQSGEASHTDIQFCGNLNLWRDWMPPEIESLLLDKPTGNTGELVLPPGTLVPEADPRDIFELSVAKFNQRRLRHKIVSPRAGRFYPKGFIAGIRDIYSEDFTPFRVGIIDGEMLTADIGHPLAGREVKLAANILDIWSAGCERGGRAQDVPQLIAGHGPGMQARWRGLETDFFSDGAFSRTGDEDDAVFYTKPRFVDHLDSTALRQVRRLYSRVLPRGACILDLMSSVNSHLDIALEPDRVYGLGMNADELAANPVLTERVVHDLNHDPELPFDDEIFDAVVCTVSVEYLVRPLDVFASVARCLKPGGRFVVSFSNRWFPPKAIQVWADLHPFERMGLVTEYFLRTGKFRALQTFSLAGLPRPADDKYAGQMQWSDPVYAVWGEKA